MIMKIHAHKIATCISPGKILWNGGPPYEEKWKIGLSTQSTINHATNR